MNAQLAYGAYDRVEAAIADGLIPANSIIIEKFEDGSAGLAYHDSESILKHIVSKTQFDSTDDAVTYLSSQSCIGKIITILEDNTYNAYLVQADNSLSSLKSGTIVPETVQEILQRTQALEDSSHTHTNLSVLESITEERIASWDRGSGLIDKVTVNGSTLPISNRTIDIPLATLMNAGVVKSSVTENTIAVLADGTMEVNSLNVNKLSQNVNEDLILSCGAAM